MGNYGCPHACDALPPYWYFLGLQSYRIVQKVNPQINKKSGVAGNGNCNSVPSGFLAFCKGSQNLKSHTASPAKIGPDTTKPKFGGNRISGR
jgi:hypothetical protein